MNGLECLFGILLMCLIVGSLIEIIFLNEPIGFIHFAIALIGFVVGIINDVWRVNK